MRSPYDSGRPAETGDLDQVTSLANVTRIVDEMRNDLEAHPGDWETVTLETFLEALSRSLTAHPQPHHNFGEPFPDPPTWKLFAEATVYE
ncbi:DUF7660 family protein [Dactylosporangium sp. CA-233914]|uniref:DUF7660 family protein n=1 Tax=Dactylosporangium sp. CA-233914 TaxID=3239934 RepID=UPI003D936240